MSSASSEGLVQPVGSTEPVLEVDDLSVEFSTRRGVLRAVDAVSLRVERGQVLGVVGESGSGKSDTAKAILGILPGNGSITSGRIRLGGEDLVGKPEEWMRRMRSHRIGLVPQNPMTALDPVLTGHDVERAADRVRVHERVVEIEDDVHLLE